MESTGMMRKWISVLVLVSLVLLCSAFLAAQEAVSQEKSLEIQADEEGKTIIPSPKDIKERTAIYVFLGWIWLAIIVLVFVLRAKIREVDRLLCIRFFRNQKE
jgi:hypothetical protein